MWMHICQAPTRRSVGLSVRRSAGATAARPVASPTAANAHAAAHPHSLPHSLSHTYSPKILRRILVALMHGTHGDSNLKIIYYRQIFVCWVFNSSTLQVHLKYVSDLKLNNSYNFKCLTCRQKIETYIYLSRLACGSAWREWVEWAHRWSNAFGQCGSGSAAQVCDGQKRVT